MLCGCIDIGTNTTRVLVAEARDGAPHRGPAAACVHAPGPRADARAGRSRRRGSPRPRASSPSRSRWRAKPARRRSARSPRPSSAAPPTATSSAPRCAGTAASRCACSTARRRRGWPSSAPPARSGGRWTGGSRSSTSAAARARSRSARSTAASSGGARSTFGSGLPRRRALRARPADARAELDAVRARVARLLARIAPPPVDTAVAVGGSAASLRRLVGDVLDAEQPRSARSPCSPAARPRTSRSASTSTSQRVRLMPAGLLALDAAGQALGPPAADRRAAACARACCSTWRACDTGAAAARGTAWPGCCDHPES